LFGHNLPGNPFIEEWEIEANSDFGFARRFEKTGVELEL
jgi:hypothetical protein